MVRVSGESKSRLVKAAGAESCVQRRNQKLHAAVARSTFWSENAEKLRGSEHFLKLRCSKIARRCGEKHILKPKCTKHVSFGPLLKVTMSKNCTPLWREAHFEVKMYKARQLRTALEVTMSKNCTPLWREALFEVKMYKTRQLRTTFRSYDVGKLHAVVARSISWRQNVQNTACSSHFLKLRCWKIVRRCGEKHISKSKPWKTDGLGALFEVEMLKNCTPLWREAHFQVKTLKNWRSRSTFWSWDVEKLHAAVARSTFPSQNVKKLMVSDHFLKFRWRKISQVVR